MPTPDLVTVRVTEDPSSPPAGGTQRYVLRQRGAFTLLFSSSSSTMGVLLDPGKAAGRHDLNRYPEGTIFLDGACRGSPFLDNRRRQYSLDHHEGCIRSFTLATCEQVLVLLNQGLPLGSGEWMAVINDLDEDSILSAWLLLNHGELLADNKELLKSVIPFVRLEGCIDAHGMDAVILSGYQGGQLKALETVLQGFRESILKPPEDGAKKDSWRTLSNALAFLDSAFISESRIKSLSRFAVHGSTDLGGGKIAILCSADAGIYEAETFYQQRCPGSLGLIILSHGEGKYTLRLVDRFMKTDLVAVYRTLNARDPSVTRSRDEGNAWGGSAEIGGSPRITGSGLSPEKILELVTETFTRHAVTRLLGQLFGF